MTIWDEKFIKGMIEGEQSAFEHCYRCLSPRIYTAIYHICKNEAIAEEILQETFISAFEHIANYQSTNSFISWLKRIAFNKTINVINRDKKGEQIVEELSNENAMEQSPEVQFSEHNLVMKILAIVPEHERLVLWLYIVEQYSHEEIARLVDRTPSYSKSIVSRSLKKLKSYSEEKSYVYR